MEKRSKLYKKAQVKKIKRRGKVKEVKVLSLTARSKAIVTLDQELANQRFAGCPADSIKPKLKGKSSSWRRGGEFPANRPRVGDSGRARWRKGNNWQDLTDNPGTVLNKRYHEQD